MLSYDTAKTKKLAIFCTHLVDFCRPGHNRDHDFLVIVVFFILVHYIVASCYGKSFELIL